MHLRMASWFEKRFGRDFTMRVRPGETGIDVTANTDYAARILGARHAEFKPRSVSGERTFNRQLERWGIDRSDVRVFTYDRDGNIYDGF